MTWKEFKATVEAAGVVDDMPIDFIDLYFPDKVNVTLPRAEGEGFTIL